MSKASKLLQSAREDLEQFQELMKNGSVSKSDQELFGSVMSSFDNFEKSMNEEVGFQKKEDRSVGQMSMEESSDSERYKI